MLIIVSSRADAYFDSEGDTYTFTPTLSKLNSTTYSFKICAYRTSSSYWNINLLGASCVCCALEIALAHHCADMNSFKIYSPLHSLPVYYKLVICSLGQYSASCLTCPEGCAF